MQRTAVYPNQHQKVVPSINSLRNDLGTEQLIERHDEKGGAASILVLAEEGEPRRVELRIDDALLGDDQVFKASHGVLRAMSLAKKARGSAPRDRPCCNGAA
jgi:hypothetical protein